MPVILSVSTTVYQAEAKMVEVRTELSDEYGRRLEEKEEGMKRITEDLNNVREKHTSARDQVRERKTRESFRRIGVDSIQVIQRLKSTL